MNFWVGYLDWITLGQSEAHHGRSKSSHVVDSPGLSTVTLWNKLASWKYEGMHVQGDTAL